MNHSESEEEHLHKIEHFTQEITTTNRITAGGKVSNRKNNNQILDRNRF